MTKLRLLYIGYVMRIQDSPEKTITLGNVDSSRKTEKPNVTWIDSIKEAMTISLQVMSRAANDRTVWR